MSGSPATTAAAAPEQPAAGAHPAHFGDNKGIKFQIQSGNQKWACVLQDRGSYEKKKAARQDSIDTDSSSASESTK